MHEQNEENLYLGMNRKFSPVRKVVQSYKIVFLICLLSVEEIHLCHFVLRESLYGSSVPQNVILFVHTQKVTWENL